jgi:hypothetical protein
VQGGLVRSDTPVEATQMLTLGTEPGEGQFLHLSSRDVLPHSLLITIFRDEEESFVHIPYFEINESYPPYQHRWT